jgi:molecular chaperone GrpE
METPEPNTNHQPGAAKRSPTVEELEERWRRAAADLDNFRKRCARQIELERAGERARVARLWLPLLDDLERALTFASEGPGPGAASERAPNDGAPNERAPDEGDDLVVEGIRNVRDQAVVLLGGLGYRRDDETDVPFDPFRHEAIGVAEGVEAPPGTVVDVVRPGYGRGEHQLRPAAVLVAGQR